MKAHHDITKLTTELKSSDYVQYRNKLFYVGVDAGNTVTNCIRTVSCLRPAVFHALLCGVGVPPTKAYSWWLLPVEHFVMIG